MSEKEVAPAVQQHPGAWLTDWRIYEQDKDTAQRSTERGVESHSPRSRRALPPRTDGRGRARGSVEPYRPAPASARVGVEVVRAIFAGVAFSGPTGIYALV